MNNQEVIEQVRDIKSVREMLEEAIRLARADERQRCASIVDEHGGGDEKTWLELFNDLGEQRG